MEEQILTEKKDLIRYVRLSLGLILIFSVVLFLTGKTYPQSTMNYQIYKNYQAEKGAEISPEGYREYLGEYNSRPIIKIYFVMGWISFITISLSIIAFFILSIIQVKRIRNKETISYVVLSSIFFAGLVLFCVGAYMFQQAWG